MRAGQTCASWSPPAAPSPRKRTCRRKPASSPSHGWWRMWWRHWGERDPIYDFPLPSSSPHPPEIQAIALPLVHDASGSIVIPVPLRQMGLPPTEPRPCCRAGVSALDDVHPMLPRILLATAPIPGGGELRLVRRGGDFVIMAGT